MLDFFNQVMPNVMNILSEIPGSIAVTIVMLVVAGFISFVFGLLLGVLMIATKKGGVYENRMIFSLFDKLINLFRAIPFIILIPIIMPLTRALLGTSIGVKGAIPVLVVGTIPFFARQIESALSEVDHGLIEASQAMGSSPMEIITRVYLKESIPGIVRATTITLISLLGLIAIVGTLGAGGLGDLAIRLGYNRNMVDVTYVMVFFILIIISIVQMLGDFIIKKTTH
ncbi:MAG: methionine ABC transporter permease [Erysipelotrichaceae bacterium]